MSHSKINWEVRDDRLISNRILWVFKHSGSLIDDDVNDAGHLLSISIVVDINNNHHHLSCDHWDNVLYFLCFCWCFTYYVLFFFKKRKKHLLPLRITNSNANRKHMREHLCVLLMNFVYIKRMHYKLIIERSTQKRLYFNCKGYFGLRENLQGQILLCRD